MNPYPAKNAKEFWDYSISVLIGKTKVEKSIFFRYWLFAGLLPLFTLGVYLVDCINAKK